MVPRRPGTNRARRGILVRVDRVLSDARGCPFILKSLSSGDGTRALRRQRLYLSRAFSSGCVSVLIGAAFGAAFLCLMPFVLRALPEAWFGAGILASYVLLLVAMMLALPRVHDFFSYGRVLRRIAALRVCASCGYDLRGLPAAPDGCTVCPECAGAWRLPPE
jgi:hypothetical protein